MKVSRWKAGVILTIPLLVFLWWGWGESDPEPPAKGPGGIIPGEDHPKSPESRSVPRRHVHEEECAGCPDLPAREDGKRSSPPPLTRAELKAMSRECRTFLMEAAADGVPDPVTSHLDGCKGKTPLHFATTSEQVQFLLDSGADPNSPDIYGGTPLHSQMFMAMSGLGDGLGIILKLLEAGADPWLTTHGGKLPLEYAQMGKYRRRVFYKGDGRKA